MRQLLCAFALTAATSALGNAFSGTDTKDAAKSLDGTWQCTYLFGASDDMIKKIKFEFAGTKATITNGDMTSTARIKTDITKKPAEIDLIVEDGPAKGQISLGHFVLKNDELAIKLGYPGHERPEGFASGMIRISIGLKRVK